MTSLRLQNFYVLISLALTSTCALAQVQDPASACASSSAVLQRYVEAVGVKAANEIQTRTVTAHESTKGFGTEPDRYVYKIKWKAPNKVAVGNNPYIFNIFAVSYPNGAFIFDGKSWSNFDRRRSRNDERDPQWKRDLRARYVYNEDPFFLELRVIADPLILTRADELYSSFEADTASAEAPGLCVLRANQVRLPRNERQDLLYFDAVSGLLRTWKIHTGIPPHNTLVQFQFDDYRQVGGIKFPFYVHLDFNDSTFQYTSVVQNRPLADAEFQEKPARP